MTTTARTDDLELLRYRVARFGLVAGALGLLACAFRIPRLFVSEQRSGFASYVWHVGAACAFFLLPLLSRFLNSRRALLWVDATVLPVATLLYGCMGQAILLESSGSAAAIQEGFTGFAAQQTVLLAATYCVFARAIYIPSSGRRTLGVTAACFPGIVVATPVHTLDAFGNAVFWTGACAGALMWWTMSMIVTTIASNVIYGLRKEVRAVREYGQYTLEQKVGEGGMGVVYQARHAMLRRPTALKLLPPDRAGGTSIARFEKEVRLTARLTHPNTVTIFDYGRTPDGVFYYAMELLDGETLEDIVAATGPLEVARVLRVSRQIAGALAEAHELGLVHRDVKPANIMLCATIGGEADVAKVLDFGLVRDQNAADLGQTATNTFAGTPLYMSPEAIADPQAITAASDLYAVGAVIYFLLVGEPVFEATTTIEICASHLHRAPLPPSVRTTNPIPKDLEDLVLLCLEKDPLKRPKSARELVRALSRIEAATRGDGWDEDRAVAWWAKHRVEVSRYRKRRTPMTADSGSRDASSASRTLEVDFVSRQLR